MLTNKEYIEKNTKVKKNASGRWEASFEYADGYRITICDDLCGRQAKAFLKDYIVNAALLETKHPIQKVSK